jgi:hypothetical protein
MTLPKRKQYGEVDRTSRFLDELPPEDPGLDAPVESSATGNSALANMRAMLKNDRESFLPVAPTTAGWAPGCKP